MITMLLNLLKKKKKKIFLLKDHFERIFPLLLE